MFLVKEGRFIPVEYDGATYYVEADEDAENAVEGEFVLSIEEAPIISKKMTKEQIEEAEKKRKKYYIPATEEIKADIEKRFRMAADDWLRRIIEEDLAKRRAELMQKKSEEEKPKAVISSEEKRYCIHMP
ncbi:MAG: hypothetical protein IJH70_10415 [Oscillospiraceae bacterium]|nr:hypothetical protein [Oscillospiraceae bacterium]